MPHHPPSRQFLDTPLYVNNLLTELTIRSESLIDSSLLLCEFIAQCSIEDAGDRCPTTAGGVAVVDS